MGEEEQMRTKEKPASRKKPPIMPCGPRRSRSSEPRDEVSRPAQTRPDEPDQTILNKPRDQTRPDPTRQD